MESYEKLGHRTYGEICEWSGCGWDDTTCDVHRISYQEHRRLEGEIRQAIEARADIGVISGLLREAKSKGFLKFDRAKMKLEKDNRSHNLVVLCPNHHRYVHAKDLGAGVLKFIPPRK